MMDCRISSHFYAQRRSKDELEQNIFKQSDFKTSAKISIAGTEEVIKIKMFRKLTSTSLEGNTQCSRACYVQHSTGNRIMRGELNNRVKENMVLYIMTSLIKLLKFAHCLYLHINSPSFPSRLAPGVTESSEACIFEKYNSSPLGNTWVVFFIYIIILTILNCRAQVCYTGGIIDGVSALLLIHLLVLMTGLLLFQ